MKLNVSHHSPQLNVIMMVDCHTRMTQTTHILISFSVLSSILTASRQSVNQSKESGRVVDDARGVLGELVCRSSAFLASQRRRRLERFQDSGGDGGDGGGGGDDSLAEEGGVAAMGGVMEKKRWEQQQGRDREEYVDERTNTTTCSVYVCMWVLVLRWLLSHP